MDKKYEFENMYFNDESDAKYILRLMLENIEKLGSVLVWEFYEFADFRGAKWDSNHELYGWTKLDNVNVKISPMKNFGDLYYIDLPEPEYIDVERRVILEDGRA